MSPAHAQERVGWARCPQKASHPPQRPQGDPHSHYQPPESLSGPAYLSDSLGVPLGLGTGGSCSLPR